MTTSFMQTNQKFNSAMVFETQIDPQQAKDKVMPVPIAQPVENDSDNLEENKS